jgi:hypothetical protein
MHIRLPVIAAALALLSAHASGAEKPDDHPPAAAALPSDAPITVTINPESRVSVTLGGVIPPQARPGTPVAWAVRVVNQGFATGRLEAQLVGDPAPGAVLDYNPERLKGSPTEMRTLRITLTNSAPTDLTIAFRLSNEAPDLGGRDRIHVLIRPL